MRPSRNSLSGCAGQNQREPLAVGAASPSIAVLVAPSRRQESCSPAPYGASPAMLLMPSIVCCAFGSRIATERRDQIADAAVGAPSPLRCGGVRG